MIPLPIDPRLTILRSAALAWSPPRDVRVRVRIEPSVSALCVTLRLAPWSVLLTVLPDADPGQLACRLDLHVTRLLQTAAFTPPIDRFDRLSFVLARAWWRFARDLAGIAAELT